MADINKDKPEGQLKTVEDIIKEHWVEYGRNYYQRYDYEGLETEHAVEIFKLLDKRMGEWESLAPGNKATNFSYTDPVD